MRPMLTDDHCLRSHRSSKNESNNFFCIFSSFSWFFMIKFGEEKTDDDYGWFNTSVKQYSYPVKQAILVHIILSIATFIFSSSCTKTSKSVKSWPKNRLKISKFTLILEKTLKNVRRRQKKLQVGCKRLKLSRRQKVF